MEALSNSNPSLTSPETTKGELGTYQSIPFKKPVGLLFNIKYASAWF